MAILVVLTLVVLFTGSLLGNLLQHWAIRDANGHNRCLRRWINDNRSVPDNLIDVIERGGSIRLTRNR